MVNANPLLLFVEERRALLKKITNYLENDLRVAAAWLTGSLGRGQGDALSDLDVWMVIEDDSIQAVVEGRRDFVSQIDRPVLFVEAPQNAPQNGGYLMAHYDAPTAPHQVDWVWQPRSLAAIPDQTLLLFDRAGLPKGNLPAPSRGGGPVKEFVEQPLHFISFFWAMLMITGKYAARLPGAEEMELLPYAAAEFKKTLVFLGREPAVEIPAHIDPSVKLLVLRRLADEMAAMMPEVAKRGGQVPDEIVPGAYRFLDLVEYSLGQHSRSVSE